MRLHFLVEGPSEKALLNNWLPRFLPPGHTFRIYPHRGKGKIPDGQPKPPDPRHQGLLDQLPAKLRAFGKERNTDTDRIVVLVDLDRDKCTDLKQRMVRLLEYCDPQPVVLFRIAIEETEAFYLGDLAGIKSAFPKAKLSRMKDYEQDCICGTWEIFQLVINAETEDKVAWAEQMGRYLTTDFRENRSHSFQQFCKAILTLAGESTD